ncbi:uroporphyrinogen-III synthase [Variovorax soli]|uniref:uroporphyrinogen-III synthase n=1 Tax=Variovorax soli TaxID=376815 RepID=UPI00286D53C2|nr:uroporphyrinogen-III synthase [Variovorax soli]
MPAPRVIVTRPAREAARWVEALRSAGVDAQALPLIAIAPVADGKDLQAALQRLDHYAALMFVSAAAAEHFFDGAASVAAGLRSRCWATGPGTIRALQQAGVPARAIDAPAADAAQFDSEALWAQVQAQVRPGLRVLIVRGGDAAGQPAGRAWLMREIAAAGGACDTVVAYRRLPAPLDDAARELAGEGARGEAIWLFSSAEAISRLRAALPDTSWGSARAIATHPRIAEAARDVGFGAVCVSSPALPALIASIESFA